MLKINQNFVVIRRSLWSIWQPNYLLPSLWCSSKNNQTIDTKASDILKDVTGDVNESRNADQTKHNGSDVIEMEMSNFMQRAKDVLKKPPDVVKSGAIDDPKAVESSKEIELKKSGSARIVFASAAILKNISRSPTTLPKEDNIDAIATGKLELNNIAPEHKVVQEKSKIQSLNKNTNIEQTSVSNQSKSRYYTESGDANKLFQFIVETKEILSNPKNMTIKSLEAGKLDSTEIENELKITENVISTKLHETTKKTLDRSIEPHQTHSTSKSKNVDSSGIFQKTGNTKIPQKNPFDSNSLVQPISGSLNPKETKSQTQILPPIKQPKIVIIGAGIAGLTAAQTLVQSGLRSLTLLEASERYGGRIFTKQFGDVNHCELGTHYLDFSPAHGHSSNLKLPWLRDFAFLNSSGNPIEFKETKSAMSKFEQIQKDIAKSNETEEKSLYHFLSNQVDRQMQKVPRDERSSATRVFCGIMQNMRSNFGTDLVNVDTKISPRGLNRHSELRPLNGCANYLAPLVDVLPADALRLGTPVGRIEYNLGKYKDYPVMISTLAGATFMADYAIVTLPLSVMKSLGSTMFDPPLPQSKVWSMSRMGVGTVEKIFLNFEDPIDGWYQKAYIMALTPTEAEDRRHWTTGMSTIERVAKSKHVLEITVAGRQAADMRLMPDDRVADEAHAIIQRYHPTKRVPKPQAIMRSNWSMDTRFLGSHVYPSVKTNLQHVQYQQQPLSGMLESTKRRHPIIFFAGDSTADPDLLGTVLGARLSGAREAKKIVNLVKQNQVQNIHLET